MPEAQPSEEPPRGVHLTEAVRLAASATADDEDRVRAHFRSNAANMRKYLQAATGRRWVGDVVETRSGREVRAETVLYPAGPHVPSETEIRVFDHMERYQKQIVSRLKQQVRLAQLEPSTIGV